jgi:hypothetical protein
MGETPWICEVLSLSRAATNHAERMPIDAREHVGHMWLADPIAKTLEAFHLENGRWVLLGTWRDDAEGRVNVVIATRAAGSAGAGSLRSRRR